MQSINDSIITAVNIDTVYYFTAEAVARDTSVIIRFNNLPEVYGNLVIYAPRGCQNQYIDNIMLEEIPNCIPVESGNVNNITATSAQVEWGVPYGYEGATGYSYMVEYGPRFFEPGTGVRQESDSTSISLSGLAMGSNYDVYIYTLCSNDTATAYGPIRFSTMCGVVDSLPYIMDFEGINQGIDIVQDLPTCWNWAWVQYPGTVQIVNTSNPTLASSGQYCLSLSNKSVVALPTMPVDLNQLKVQFHLYRDEPATTTIIVGAVDSLEAGFEVSFVGIDTLEYEENVYERQVTLYLSEYTGTSRNLALYVTNEKASTMLDAVAICGKNLVAYVSDGKADTAFTQDYIKRTMRAAGYGMDVKLMKNLDKFIERMDSMNEHAESLREDIAFTPDSQYPDYTREQMVWLTLTQISL